MTSQPETDEMIRLWFGDDTDGDDADRAFAREHLTDGGLRFALRSAVHAFRENERGFELAAATRDPQSVGRDLAELVPRPSGETRWDELVGPFYRYRGAVAQLENVSSRQGLDRRRSAHRVLGCRTRDSTWLYPTFQFADGDILEGLDEILSVIVPATDGWTTALWLYTPNTGLANARPIDLLQRHEEVAAVQRAARSQAAEWSGRRIEVGAADG